MAGPQKKKRQEERTTEEAAFLAALNSQYHICQPLYSAENIRITHPFTKMDKVMKTSSAEFYEFFGMLCSKGLTPKLVSELTEFGNKYDAKWFDVLENAMAKTVLNTGETGEGLD